MKKTFSTEKTINFRDADPAGIMFFGNVFGFAHDAYEEFVAELGFTWDFWFKNQDFFIPLRNANADYFAPLTPGNTYQIQVFVGQMSNTSFTMKYNFVKNAKVHTTVSLVHTFVDPKTMSKMNIPEIVRAKFSEYLEGNDLESND